MSAGLCQAVPAHVQHEAPIVIFPQNIYIKKVV